MAKTENPKAAGALHARFVNANRGRFQELPRVGGKHAPALIKFGPGGGLPGQKRGATTVAKCRAPSKKNPCPATLFFVGRSLSAKHGLAPGAYLRLCHAANKPGAAIPVKDAADALRKHAAICGCAKRQGGKTAFQQCASAARPEEGGGMMGNLQAFVAPNSVLESALGLGALAVGAFFLYKFFKPRLARAAGSGGQSAGGGAGTSW